MRISRRSRPLAAQDGTHAVQDGLDARQDERRQAGGGGGAPSSGNRAFDDYRTETLRRLEDEQREFKDFLERLRFAKDKTEFDTFMAERRNRPAQESPAPRRADPPKLQTAHAAVRLPRGGRPLRFCSAVR